MECKDTAYRAISPDGLKGFPLEGKHPKVDPLGSEGNSQGKKKAKVLIDYRHIEIGERSVFLKEKGMSLDLGGIAKEY
ncbi:MAG: hypothetical protein ACFNO5_02930, partial [Porphyromonas pasteri]